MALDLGSPICRLSQGNFQEEIFQGCEVEQNCFFVLDFDGARCEAMRALVLLFVQRKR